MKKKYSTPIVFIAATLLLSACSTGNNGDVPKVPVSKENNISTQEPNYIGENLKYDLNAPVNGGEAMQLTIWTDPEIKPFFEEAANKYSQIHSNISFNIVEHPWGDYWTKLPLALSSGSGPDIYRSHAAHIKNLIQYSSSLDPSVFPMEDLKADYPLIEDIAIDEKLYSVPLGFTFGTGIYYNKNMWTEAGLSEADIPTTWDQFAEVGKRLTRKDSNGNVTQYGFSIDHAFEKFLVDLNYQKGYALFEEDLSSWNLDQEGTYENIEMIRGFIEDQGFMMYSDGDCEDQFGHEQVAMIYNLSWVAGYFNDTFPEIDWGFFPMPTKDGQTPPAYGQKIYEWTMGVAAKDEAKKAVAFDFMKYYMCEEETFLKHALRMSVVPAKQNLQTREETQQYESLAKVSAIADRLVYAGVIPTDEMRQTGLRAAGSDIFINGKDPKTVIGALEKDLADAAIKNNYEIKSAQDRYAHYDELKK